MLSNMQSELSKDPLAFSMNRGLTDSNNNKIELNQLNLTGDSVELSASIKERINYSNIVANRYNIEPKFFTEQEKNSLVETLRTADRATQMYLLGGIVDGGGQNAPDMLAEISGSSPEFAGIGALVNAGNMSVASSALSGFEALSSGFKPLDFTATNTDRPFNALTSVALRYLPNSSEISRTVATAIYADIARFEDTFSESLWNQAINQSLGGSVKAGESFGGIQEVRGQKTLVPSNLTPDIIEAALKNITPESLAFASGGQIVDAGLVKDISGMGMFVADSNYTIVSRGGDDFAITLGDADKLNPLFVSDVNDNPIQFNIQKLVEALQ